MSTAEIVLSIIVVVQTITCVAVLHWHGAISVEETDRARDLDAQYARLREAEGRLVIAQIRAHWDPTSGQTPPTVATVLGGDL
jgi:hypothetical protein